MNYVIITPARNEASVIVHTLASVVAQTRLPDRWVIVDDGSTDETPALVQEYAARHPWIQLVQMPPRVERHFAGKAYAVKAGLAALGERPYDVIVNLDADVSFAPDYMEFLLQKFAENPRLGVGGTPFTQDGGYDSTRDSFEGSNYVAGPCQLFRAECFAEIGGYVANRAGGVDWIAVMTARMKGWTVTAFPDKRFHHHRSMGTAERGEVAALFSYGEKDYYLGGSPVWQLFRVAFRLAKPPVVVGGVALLAGYVWAAVRRVERPVSPELVRFHRREQMKKLRSVLGSVVRLKRPSAFTAGEHSASETAR
jgi:poly-beta-1,6-N-acetyl-D-glucosamine synthase